MYNYIYIYIYTNTPKCPAPNPLLLLSFYTARGAHSVRGLMRRVLPGVDLGNIKWQIARAARVPIPGPSHPYPAFSLRNRNPISGLHTHLASSLSKKDLLLNLKAGSKLCLPNESLLGGAGRRRAAIPLTSRYACVRRHRYIHQPRLPNEGSGSGG